MYQFWEASKWRNINNADMIPPQLQFTHKSCIISGCSNSTPHSALSRHILQVSALDPINFTTFFSAMGKCQEWELALHGLRLAHALSLQLNDPAYNSLLTCLEACDRYALADSSLSRF